MGLDKWGLTYHEGVQTYPGVGSASVWGRGCGMKKQRVGVGGLQQVSEVKKCIK